VKITSVLVVEEIEKALPFWVDRVGFEKIVEAPEEGHIGFAILVRDGAELMFQTVASVAKDTPRLVPQNKKRGATLFIEVEDLGDGRACHFLRHARDRSL
jgi:hypothetical protein